MTTLRRIRCKSVCAYGSLPVTASPEEFGAGHGNWSLTEQEFGNALALTRIILSLKETCHDNVG